MDNKNVKAIMDWLETEGTINYMDGLVYQLSDGEFDEYYEENKSEYNSKDDYAIYLCKNALEKAGVDEEIINLCLDWNNQESTDEALEYFKNLYIPSDMEVLMADKCTKSEAERFLKNSTIVYDNVEEFVEDMNNDDVEEDELITAEKVRNNEYGDWRYIKLYGKEFVIMYVN